MQKSHCQGIHFCARRKKEGFVEVVSTCNMNWKLPPVEANQWMEENMFPFYPPGDMKDGSKHDIHQQHRKKLTL
jgi:2-oxoglutarate ferredoxin oxidoreductase subunit beta